MNYNNNNELLQQSTTIDLNVESIELCTDVMATNDGISDGISDSSNGDGTTSTTANNPLAPATTSAGKWDRAVGDTSSSLNLSRMNSLECWDYSIELECLQGSPDLQLAAELGNTLLERNKELEKSLRQHQNIIEDQAQEIEYLNKQTAALKEVNDSRLRIYEQLEVSIQDLERGNHRLAVENSNDKKQIKNLLSQIETLEEKCEELQKNLDDVTRQLNLTRRHQQRLTNTTTTINNTLSNSAISTTSAAGEQNGKLRLRANNKNKLENGTSYQDGGLHMSQENTMECDSSNLDMMTIDEDDDESTTADEVDHNATSTTTLRYYNNNTNKLQDINMINNATTEYSDEIIQLLKELADERAQRTRDQRRVTELEEQMTSLLHQIQALEQQLAEYHQKEVMTSMQEEISTLEEVRDGHLCAHCLRNIDEHARDELSALLDQESVVYEDDNTLESANDSIINEMPYKSTISLEIQDLIELTTWIIRLVMACITRVAAPSLYFILLELFLFVRDYILLPVAYKSWRFTLCVVDWLVVTHDKIARC